MNRGRAIPRDQLADLLWSTGDAMAEDKQRASTLWTVSFRHRSQIGRGPKLTDAVEKVPDEMGVARLLSV
jgi:hypothetical protein